MPGKKSAGVLLYRWREGELEVLLVHPGGPFWARKDAGAWSIPKGEIADGEDPLAVARREFHEETGFPIESALAPLTPIVQRGGKTVHAYAGEGDLDVERLRSNTFTLQWPPRSGRRQEFPEVDRGAWFDLAAARGKLLEAQRPLLDELEARLRSPGEPE
jgi:predicted NUDIX family NTP pyrophosphohydrolase